MSDGTVHAACVAAEGRGLLILGRPGAGKSALALDLVALGAGLVADDRVALSRDGAALTARAPAALAGMVEARGIGLLRAPHAAWTRLALAIDLDRAADARLPPLRRIELLGVALPVILRPEPLRPAAVLAALRFGPPIDPEGAVTP